MDNYWTFNEVIELVRNLAESQGSYGRLLESLENANDMQIAAFNKALVEQKINDPVSFIMWWEG